MTTKYKRLKELGRGGYGAAILACDRKDKRKRYVVKEVRLADMSAAEIAAAHREADFLAQLDHANIVKYIESYEERNKLCIVMEYADGGDLSQLLTKRREAESPLSEEEALGYFVQICLGMKHIHDKSIVHRDIKSQNVFLARGGIVKLGDFGVAKALADTADMARTQIGTPYYLSPELVAGEPYNRKTDIWSLGVLLYEMLALKLPFTGSNIAALISRISQGIYAPIPSRYSAGLRELVARMLRQAPSERPTIRQVLLSPIIRTRVASMVRTLNSRSMGQGVSGEAALEGGGEEGAAAPPAPGAVPVYEVDLSAPASPAAGSGEPSEGGGQGGHAPPPHPGRHIPGGGHGADAAYAAERARRLAAMVVQRKDQARLRRDRERHVSEAQRAARAGWDEREVAERQAAALARKEWLERERSREAQLEAAAMVQGMAAARERARSEVGPRAGAAQRDAAAAAAAAARQRDWEERQAIAARAKARAEAGGGSDPDRRGGQRVAGSGLGQVGGPGGARRGSAPPRGGSGGGGADARQLQAARDAFFENRRIAAAAQARSNMQLGRGGGDGTPPPPSDPLSHQEHIDRAGAVKARRAAEKEAARAAHLAAMQEAIAAQAAERAALAAKLAAANVDTEGRRGRGVQGAPPAAAAAPAEGKAVDEEEDGGAADDTPPSRAPSPPPASEEDVLQALAAARAQYQAEVAAARQRAVAAGASGGVWEGGSSDEEGGSGEGKEAPAPAPTHTRRGSSLSTTGGDLIVVDMGGAKASKVPRKPKLGSRRKKTQQKPRQRTGKPGARGAAAMGGGKEEEGGGSAPALPSGPLQLAAHKQLKRIRKGKTAGQARPERGSSTPLSPMAGSSEGSSAGGTGDTAGDEEVIQLEVEVDGMRDDLVLLLAEAEGVPDAQLQAAAAHDYDDEPPQRALLGAAQFGVVSDGQGGFSEEEEGGAASDSKSGSLPAQLGAQRHGLLPPLPDMPAPPSLSATTSSAQDIESLRLYLEEYMGDVPFVKSYAAVRAMQASEGAPTAAHEAVGRVLSREGGGRSGADTAALSSRFGDLILQLIELEDELVARRRAKATPAAAGGSSQ